MSAYQFTCPCGHEIKTDAANRGDAVSKIKGVMDRDAIAAHFREKHPGQEVMSVAAVHNLIEQRTVAV